MSVSVIGAGAFGTALAISIARTQTVHLWGRTGTTMDAMLHDRMNTARLPSVTLPELVRPTSDFDLARGADILLLAIPLQELRSLLRIHAQALVGKSLVACCKGVELGSHLGPVSIIQSEVPQAVAALLTGPSFARDIAIDLPTALTLACADRAVGQHLQQSLTTPGLRLYTTQDVIGAELGGALKNVVAIACGVVMGAGLGESARAALMTRGFAEMVRLAQMQGADPRTLSGLSGLGDLALTCTSGQSRNYSLGMRIGSGQIPDETVTVEGVATAQSVAAYAVENNLDLPITATVAALVTGQINVATAISDLMARPLREEY